MSKPFLGPRGTFHVWSDDVQRIQEYLRKLEADLEDGTVEPQRARRRLNSLERVGMTVLAPAGPRSEQSAALREQVRRIRSLLSGKPVPDPFPMQSHVLLEESNGYRFETPIPAMGGIGHSLTGGAPRKSAGKRSLRKRIRARVGRAVRRVTGLAERNRSSGPE
jgi:hypothetical protein